MGAGMFGYDLTQKASLMDELSELGYITIFAPVDSVWRKNGNAEGEDDSSIGLQVYVVNEELDFSALHGKKGAFNPLSGCNTFGTENIEKVEDRVWLVDYTGTKVVVKKEDERWVNEFVVLHPIEDLIAYDCEGECPNVNWCLEIHL